MAPQIRTVAIVGVGLIGGSVGLAVRRRGAVRVVGVDRDESALRHAGERGVIDEACTDLEAAAAAADLIVFCTPVDRVARQVQAAAAACKPGTLLTDTGSTKAGIVRAGMFEGRVVVLTPTDATPADAVAAVSAFWESLGARVRRMSPEAHDRAVSFTSHLPHLVASALAGVLPPEMVLLAATGFRDTTRVAAGDPALWAAVLEANHEEVLRSLGRFEARLAEFRVALAAADGAALTALLEAGRRLRAATDPRP